MKILIYGLNFHPELTGIGKYTGEMAAYLAEHGHHVKVITSPPYYPYWQVQPPYKAYQYKKEFLGEIEIHRCPIWVPRKASGIKRIIHLASFALSSLPVLLGQLRWKPDLIFSIAPALANAPLAILFGKLSGAKTWLHIQDFEVDAALNLGLLPSKLHSSALYFERKILTRFDRVSTISEPMLQLLYNKGKQQVETCLFPNWIDTDIIHPKTTSALREEWQIGNDKVVVLYAGNMGVKQGLEIVLDAAKELSLDENILFVLCGDGAAKQQLMEQANGLPNIQFHPLQPFEKLNDLLNMADIHILPQRADAADLVMPSKLSGMLASGKAVVATAFPETSLGQIIEEVGLLAPPGDVGALAKKIKLLANAPDMRTKLGQKGRAWVLSHWAKAEVLQNLQDEIKSMIE